MEFYCYVIFMKNNLSSHGEDSIKHPKKKFEKVVRVPPEGYDSSNDFS